jgi:hypothetical protein
MGRHRLYTPELGEEICRRLAEGESLRSICNDENMPSKTTILTWAGSPNHPLCDQYARAREIGYQLLADEIIEIADTPKLGVETKTKEDGSQETTEGDMLGHRKLQIDSRKWMLSKMLPKIYGDKITQEHKVSLSDEFETYIRSLNKVQPKVIDGSVAVESGAMVAVSTPVRAGGDTGDA